MGSFEQAFKEEVYRLARKEIKRSTSTFRAALSRQNKEISLLKKRLRTIDGKTSEAIPTGNNETPTVQRLRITPKSILALRKRHKLSQSELGRLLGVSQNTVYHWEAAKTKPRVNHMAKLDQLRTLGKKDLKRRLESPENG